MAVTCSIATRTAWRSASAVSCAPACARPAASTFAAPTTPLTNRFPRASGTGSCTRSTSSAAFTATCASRPARPRPSPSRRCSSGPSSTGRTPSTPRPSCSWTTTGRPAGASMGGLETGRRPQHVGLGPGYQHRAGRRPWRANRCGRVSSATACARPRRVRATLPPPTTRPKPICRSGR